MQSCALNLEGVDSKIKLVQMIIIRPYSQQFLLKKMQLLGDVRLLIYHEIITYSLSYFLL